MRPTSASEMDATTETGESALDLAALARALWQRRRWIVVPTLIAALASFAVVNLMTPRYKSESRVLIESRETVYNRAEGDRNVERDRTLVDAEAVQSQVQLALSRDLARKVVRELKLADRAEFNPEVSGSVFGRILALVGLLRDASRLSVEERVLDRYYERLTVYPIDKTRVIVIEFQSEDPDLAAKVANAVADGYLTLQQQSKQEAMRQASQWLSGEIERMRGRVAEAEGKVETFRSGSNLYTGPNSTSLSAQQLGELNSQLTLARSQKADAEVKARLIREQLRSGRPVESSDVVNSELIRRLNEQRVTLKAQLAEQSSTLLEQHPRIKELRAQIGDLEAQIRNEAEKLARSFENDARARRCAGRTAFLEPRSAQAPGFLARRTGCAVARARARGQGATRSAGIVPGALPRRDRARVAGRGAGRCADHLARGADLDAVFPEEAADRAAGDAGDAAVRGGVHRGRRADGR